MKRRDECASMSEHIFWKQWEALLEEVFEKPKPRIQIIAHLGCPFPAQFENIEW